MKLSSKLLALAALGAQVQAQGPASPAQQPSAPVLNFLFSVNVTIGLSLKVGNGIMNTTRAVFPISGGQAVEPRISAKVLEVGADWAFYGTLLNGVNLLTLDGANILVEAKGQTATPTSDPKSTGAVHVQATFDTVSKAYS
ncbi:hypothetical protein SCUCBS95973_000975 [Sporothrix curviconia]|uniref:Uncharacterized protein n=1 Tax=Sporothrix curviconia TaxID=1260050 RepID=A0ABP0AUT7_9PEZI